MKKYFVSALAIALVGASIASIAQSAPMDHSSHGMQGMMGMDSQDMQKKMGAAKTEEECQVLLAEQRKLMMERRAHMMPMSGWASQPLSCSQEPRPVWAASQGV